MRYTRVRLRWHTDKHRLYVWSDRQGQADVGWPVAKAKTLEPVVFVRNGAGSRKKCCASSQADGLWAGFYSVSSGVHFDLFVVLLSCLSVSYLRHFCPFAVPIATGKW